jgi:hypothetical protein
MTNLRVDDFAAIYDGPTSTPGVSRSHAHVCRGMRNEDEAKFYADSMSAKFCYLGVPSSVFVVRGPTSTTPMPFEVVTETAGYTVVHRAKRPYPGEVELLVTGDLPDHLQEVAEDVFVTHLHSNNFHPGNPARVAIDGMARGFMRSYNAKGGAMATSFARMCSLQGRLRLLRKVLAAGPPPASILLTKDKDDPLSADFWGNALSSLYRADSNGTLTEFRESSLIRQATEPLHEGSRALLALALEFSSDAHLKRHVKSVSGGMNPYQPGDVHYTVLHKTINGERGLAKSEDLFVMHGADRIKSWVEAGSPTLNEHGLACCELLLEPANLARLPCSAVGDRFMDAGLFVLSRTPAEHWGGLRRAMQLYIDAGHLDIDRRIQFPYDTYINDFHPLLAALRVGNGPAAAALIDLGCKTDMAEIFRAPKEGERNDLLDFAVACGHAEATALVAEALMRRQIRASNAPHVSAHGAAQESQAPFAAEKSAPRRRRLGV